MTIQLQTPEQVGRLVRAARTAQHLRQDDAAGAMGVSDVFLWKLEKGAPGVRLRTCSRVLRSLGITLHAETSDEVTARYKSSSKPARRGGVSTAMLRRRRRHDRAGASGLH